MTRDPKLNLKFIPLQAIACLTHYPHSGGEDPAHGVTFSVDDERTIVHERGTLCKLPDGYDAMLVNTDDPINIFKWYIGKSKDVAELGAAVETFRMAKEKILNLLGTPGVG